MKYRRLKIPRYTTCDGAAFTDFHVLVDADSPLTAENFIPDVDRHAVELDELNRHLAFGGRVIIGLHEDDIVTERQEQTT